MDFQDFKISWRKFQDISKALQIYGNRQIHKSVAKKSSVRNLQDLSVKRALFSLGGVALKMVF